MLTGGRMRSDEDGPAKRFTPEESTLGAFQDLDVAQIKGRHVTAIARQGRFSEITTTAGMPSPIGSFDSPRSETLVLPAPPSALNRSTGESEIGRASCRERGCRYV